MIPAAPGRKGAYTLDPLQLVDKIAGRPSDVRNPFPLDPGQGGEGAKPPPLRPSPYIFCLSPIHRQTTPIDVRQDMPTWLQITGAILGALGSVLGGWNIWLQWREKKERLSMYCVSRELCCFRIFNPTTRPIEIRNLVFETFGAKEKGWVQRFSDTTVQNEPFILQPFTSHDFTLSSSQTVDLYYDTAARLRVKTGSNREYEEKIQA